jgi:hypothetical protein
MLSAEEGGTTRAIGGLVFAIGVVVLLIRRTSFADPWGDFLVFAILCVLAESLYWAGFFGAREAGRALGWHSVFLVLGILLTPAALIEFLNWVGGDVNAPLNLAWIFGFTAAIAFLALLGAGLRFGALLGGLALIVAWLGLWAELLSNGLNDTDTTRWLLLIIGAILLGLAAVVGSRGAPDGAGSDLVTAGGLAAVAAGGLIAFLPQQFIVPAGLAAPSAPTSLFWDLELIVVGLALVGFGYSGALTRGPAYIGAISLLIFTVSVGLDLDDSSPAGKVIGWPLILLVIGAAVLLAGARPWLRRSGGG